MSGIAPCTVGELLVTQCNREVSECSTGMLLMGSYQPLPLLCPLAAEYPPNHAYLIMHLPHEVRIDLRVDQGRFRVLMARDSLSCQQIVLGKSVEAVAAQGMQGDVVREPCKGGKLL